MEAEDTTYKKLPVDERCVHKLWKARVDGYEEAAKIFREIDDEKSPEWNKFLGLIKKFVTDSNAVAQEKGLEAALIYVENSGNAGKTAGEVISGIVSKCMGAPKAKTRDLGIQIALMYIEIEKHEIVVEELIKGFDAKNPKTVACCISTVTQALREFGTKVVAVKPIIKKIPVLLTDRDKGVREEGKLLSVEIFRWIGAALKPQLSTLTPVLVTELETEFEKLKNDKSIPTRYLRSQQAKQAKVAAQAAENDECDDGDDGGEQQQAEIDPLDFIDPVDILSKLPKDFYEKLEAKKWQERKESLEALETLLQSPKLEPGDYGDVVRALKKVITKDSNVVLVALGGKCLASLARGLQKKFSTYASACVPAIFEKFKEKKPAVVTALRDAIDAIYPSTNLENMQEDVIEALANKNPSVKFETASFLARAFTKTLPAVFTKKLLKVYVTALLKTLNESDPAVRDASAEAIGTAKKLVGDKIISPFLTEVDALKMVKINECFEKAVIVVKIPNAKKERPATAPTKAVPAAKGGSVEPRAVSRPATSAGTKKSAPKKAGGGGSSGGGIAKSSSTAKVLPTERDLSPEEVEETAVTIIPAEIIPGLSDANWKTRLAAMETFLSAVNEIDADCGHSQVLIRVLAKKPGLKDTNFQVLKLKLEAMKVVVEKMGITVTTADYVITDVTEKLGDLKNSVTAGAALTAIAEMTKLEYVVAKALDFAFEQKSPKVQQETLLWVNNALREFGFAVNPKALLDDAKKAVQLTNPAVRQAAIQLLGTMYLYMGNSLAIFFENEKPALKQQIQTEFDKHADERPPQATRGVKKSASKGSLIDETDEEGGGGDEPQMINAADLLPRIDISGQITEALLAEISDKNWKTRNEGLTKLQTMISEARIIKPNLKDLPPTLALRLVDSNAKIASTATAICEQLATAMGPPCKQHARTFLPGFLRGLGDNKSFVREASLQCINTWGDQCGYKEFFEGEMLADALKVGPPTLKTELWGWLAEKLPNLPPKSIQKEELVACLPYLYANICDRSADVRKNANEAVLGFMIHLGFEAMVKALDKQKPASKKDIQAALDKARPNLPLKPLPKNKQQAPIEDRPAAKSIQGGGGANRARPGSSKPAANAASNAAAGGGRKKEEEIDTSPLMCVNNLKSQRAIDETKMRVLKWTFTTPREEFNELLREQMTTANVNKSLMANMFHDDFRYHLKAIETLTDDLDNNLKAQECNLDLVMKWLSLRFYDTNPSVLIKGLDYMEKVLETLRVENFRLTDYEANSFIPHLILKIGDPKDTIRAPVKRIIKQFCLMYPMTRIFTFLMDGLKSKNARQRTECLDELGNMLSLYHMVACPSPQTSFKEIAKHVSDRDNSVRNAALNCIVAAYWESGANPDKLGKMLGNLNEKDQSMIDERIKRSKPPVRLVAEVKPMSHVRNGPLNATFVNSGAGDEIPPEEDDVDENQLDDSPTHELNSTVVIAATLEPMQPQTRSIPRPFGLDPDVVAEIERDWIRSDQRQLVQITPVDIDFLYSPIKVIPYNGVSYPQEKFDQLILRKANLADIGDQGNYAVSPPQNLSKYQTQYQSHVNAPPPSNHIVREVKLDPGILQMINNISSPDTLISRAAIVELNDILESPEKQAVLRDYEEIYIQNVLNQMKILSQLPIQQSLVVYQPLLTSILTFFNSKHLGKNLNKQSLKSIMSVLLGLMADQKLSHGDDGQYTKVINAICLKILDRANFTSLNCALIQLLKETCMSSCLPKFTDLLMKCIWRNVKVIGERSNELNYEEVLYELHEFMQALPSAWWQQRPSDTPLRTVKTIIHNMAKIKGAPILQDLNKIPQHSELHMYVIKVLKTIHKETAPDGSQRSSNRESSKRMSKTTHETISQIFKLISDKETGKEGLTRLYQFKVDNPDVDFEPFLKGASPEFQNFIKVSLEDIEKRRAANDGDQRLRDSNLNSIGGNRGLSQSNNTTNIADHYMERLMMLRREGKISSPGVDHNTIDNKTADENLNLNQVSRGSVLNKEMLPGLSANRREMLAQKLAILKQDK